MNPPSILIAGIGNIFLGDDAFGVEVAQRLLRRPQRPDVRVVDFGIRGLDLVYALQEGCELLILIDAVPRRDGPPGTLYVLEPQLNDVDNPSQSLLIDAHSMDPLNVLRTAAAMGATPGHTVIVGCEPATLPADFDEGAVPMEMSVPVSAAMEEAVALVESLVEKFGRPLSSPEKSNCKEMHTWAT